MEPEHIPDRFWDALEAARPHLSALEAWLGSQPREVLEEFALAYECAAGALADFSEGVRVDGDAWSEDGTEDLCLWVVGQGRGLWRSVLAGDPGLEDVAQLYLGRVAAGPGQAVRWDTEVSDPRHRGYQSPGAIAHGVYRSRFGEDLHERLADT
ncbi:hypothetical protein ACFXAF_26790 [Kitasatospora sp. NPDC059463]|uniref:hypothetical protein n=1 Tax=unclassified Kitasatospora TaxID=2633591 RepID=UPI0036A6B9DE